MARPSEARERQRSRTSAKDASSPGEGAKRRLGRKSTASKAGVGFWSKSKRPVLRFVLVLGTLMVLFNVFFYIGVSEDSVFGSYLNLNARFTAAFVNAFGDDATVSGTSIGSSRFRLGIAPGCDGIQAAAFFVFALFASPAAVPLLARIPAMVAGTLLLLSMNLVRIISLYYAGIYTPSLFEVLHVEVWQAVFIFVPLVMWVTWEGIVRRRGATRANVAN